MADEHRSPILAPYAASEACSRGRRHAEPPPRHRGEFQRDRDRVIHSTAFRRLEYKTQVFVNHEGDHFRTRLTHSIEVAQIGRSIARALGLNEDLSEAIALAHDLGHTPFGHAGQDALNACMKDYGGFEHNLQSLRIVDELECRYADFDGLNLTFETREGILKHCSRDKALSLDTVAERFIRGGQPSLEAQLTNLADEIAYNNHDVDDGLRAGLLDIEALRSVRLFREAHDAVLARHRGGDVRRIRHEVVRRMIDRLVVDLIETSRSRIAAAAPASVDEVRNADRPLIAFSDEMAAASLELKRHLREHLYRHHKVHRMTVKAQRLVRRLFAAFMEDERLLPPEFRRPAGTDDAERGRARAAADYIAGMTDRFAIAEHGRLFDPARLS